MINSNKLKTRMSEMRITQEELAEYVGVTVPVILQKINNVRPFPLREADKVANKLRIKDEEFGKYFFSDRKIIPVRSGVFVVCW